PVLDPHGHLLPRRLAEILSLAAEGLTDKQIATYLGIGTSTVESHWKRLRALFKASSRIEILARAVRTRETLEQLDKDKLVENL
ncbi:helix-turn-helix transcriptional regulator, partial [Acinetobacter baumannii]